VGCSGLGVEQLGWDELVRRGVDRQDVVGRLLVWLELERAYVVRSHLERFVMVGQDVERKDLVRSHVERIRVVGRLVGRGRRAIGTVLGGLGKHTLGGLDAPPLV
jgi:hypothetical protein